MSTLNKDMSGNNIACGIILQCCEQLQCTRNILALCDPQKKEMIKHFCDDYFTSD